MNASEYALRVTEFSGSRFSTALELMSEGRTMAYENILFFLNKNREIVDVSVVTQWQVSNLSDSRALEEIERAVAVFESLVESSSAFRSTIDGCKPRYSLIDDYGMGCIELCHLDNGRLVWNH